MTRSIRTKFSPRKISLALCSLGILAAGSAFAQEPNPTSVQAPREAVITQSGDIFFYKVQVVQRDIDAVNYFHRSGSTKVGFQGTELLPGAHGQADVKSERGKITVDADFKGLTPANGFGPEYLTYVLWAISPDGRPANLGEVLPEGTKTSIKVSVPLQAFGLIVTAEPYYAVSTPSDVVVLKNVFTEDTTGVLERVTAHTTLYPRGSYSESTDGAHTIARPITRNERSPLELYEAYNAVRIASVAGAEKYSPDILAKANEDLKNASDMDSSKKRDVKLEITFARQAVERAEDARVDTLRKQSAERQRNAELAKNKAQDEAAASQMQAQQSQMQAQQSQLQAQQSEAQAEKAKMDAERARIAAEQAQADKAKADAEAAEARARAAAANQEVANANQMREKLKMQLNAVLATSESARGLIVNMADVLFDTGKYTLKQGTQISLAKVAGILQAYPGLKVRVEGYTDTVGGDEYNQKLSENRANGVMNFLVSQGVAQDHISAQGFGKTNPVADNATAAGRSQNRRVNLVVSGDAIGISDSAAEGK